MARATLSGPGPSATSGPLQAGLALGGEGEENRLEVIDTYIYGRRSIELTTEGVATTLDALVRVLV